MARNLLDLEINELISFCAENEDIVCLLSGTVQDLDIQDKIPAVLAIENNGGKFKLLFKSLQRKYCKLNTHNDSASEIKGGIALQLFLNHNPASVLYLCVF